MATVCFPVLVHWYVLMVWPLAAALLCARSEIDCPALTAAGTVTAAIGRRAAFTAPRAFAMPAPQVFPSNVQMHSAVCRSVARPEGTWHAGGGVVASADV